VQGLAAFLPRRPKGRTHWKLAILNIPRSCSTRHWGVFGSGVAIEIGGQSWALQWVAREKWALRAVPRLEGWKVGRLKVEG
jgi:hypothetical protein